MPLKPPPSTQAKAKAAPAPAPDPKPVDEKARRRDEANRRNLQAKTIGPLKKKVPEDQALDPQLTRGGLFLKLTGLERCELHGSTVLMPEGFSQPTATSLNHAFTLLSQAHEKHRISNTGNVYTRVFYEDRDKRWYPLDDLRMGVQAAGERHLLHGLWAEVEQKLGWRPTPVADRSRRRK